MTNSQDRRAEREAKIAHLKAAERRDDRKAKVIAFSILGVAVALLVAIVFVIVGQASKSSDSVLPQGGTHAPKVANDDNGITVGASGEAGSVNEGAPVVSIYADYMCPACGLFEEVNVDDINELREEGVITVDYRLVSILDNMSQGTRYSTRAASAAATVAQEDKDKFVAFNDALFEAQPKENTKGLSNDKIIKIAKDVKVSEDGLKHLVANRYGHWVVESTKSASEEGMTGTPYITIDGKELDEDIDWSKPGQLREHLEELAAK